MAAQNNPPITSRNPTHSTQLSACRLLLVTSFASPPPSTIQHGNNAVADDSPLRRHIDTVIRRPNFITFSITKLSHNLLTHSKTTKLCQCNHGSDNIATYHGCRAQTALVEGSHHRLYSHILYDLWSYSHFGE